MSRHDAIARIEDWDELRERLDRLVADLNAIPGVRATITVNISVRLDEIEP